MLQMYSLLLEVNVTLHLLYYGTRKLHKGQWGHITQDTVTFLGGNPNPCWKYLVVHLNLSTHCMGLHL